jgi:hypothetical protein
VASLIGKQKLTHWTGPSTDDIQRSLNARVES